MKSNNAETPTGSDLRGANIDLSLPPHADLERMALSMQLDEDILPSLDEVEIAEITHNTASGDTMQSLTAHVQRGSTPDTVTSNTTTSSPDRWHQQFDALKSYMAEYGHCEMPQAPGLGAWVNKVRPILPPGFLDCPCSNYFVLLLNSNARRRRSLIEASVPP